MMIDEDSKPRIKKRWVTVLCTVASVVGYVVATYGEQIISLCTRIVGLTSGT